ncbi:Myb-like_DNA-binding domain-containing protein [Hexamita inflata]|uniref:Myb-like DNA-binding domain-containing protein n=1 Tax=Hexamita inflata TaxID=28002 RepID=A0AA86NC38_9EUKA|nr:Myb-like DNA-binding domain-containing protein [Hexamita inflata]
MNKREYKRWSDIDRNKLIDLVKQNISSTGRIYWDIVTSHFENRTILQCKNYYQNLVKPQLGQDPHAKHIINIQKWALSETIRLTFLIIQYGPDLCKIQVFFQDRTSEELLKQVQYINKLQEYYVKILTQISSNKLGLSHIILNLNQLQIRKLIGVLRMMKHRYQYLGREYIENIPVPLDLQYQLQQFIGSDLNEKMMYPMDFVEQYFFEYIEKQFGVLNLINYLPSLEITYRKMFGNDIFRI